jgi:predicted NAD/FAD-binding protein
MMPHSKAYVNQILSTLPKSQLHLSTRVQSISTIEGRPQITLHTSEGVGEAYDHVIFACHSDAVLDILRASGEGGMTREEDEILGAFKWSKNEVVLHSDVNVSQLFFLVDLVLINPS